MSEINSFSDYASKYNTNMDYSSLFGGGAPYIDNGMGGINVSDYAMIKNGSYGKLMKAYYAKQDADKLSQFGDSSKTLTLMRSSADSLKKSAEVLGDVSLYEKKKFKKKDEETGEEIEVEDYDWDAITKAVKTFVDDYNSVVEQAGNSETKNVLRNAAWMTGITEKAGNLLSKVGITIGKGNKLEFDEEGLYNLKYTDEFLEEQKSYCKYRFGAVPDLFYATYTGIVESSLQEAWIQYYHGDKIYDDLLTKNKLFNEADVMNGLFFERVMEILEEYGSLDFM